MVIMVVVVAAAVLSRVVAIVVVVVVVVVVVIVARCGDGVGNAVVGCDCLHGCGEREEVEDGDLHSFFLSSLSFQVAGDTDAVGAQNAPVINSVEYSM